MYIYIYIYLHTYIHNQRADKESTIYLVPRTSC